MKLVLDYNERSWGGGALSEETYSDREDQHTEFDPRSLHIDRAGLETWRVEEIELTGKDVVRGEEAFLVVIRYSSGDTFGHSFGLWQIDGVYSDSSEATAVAQNIRLDAEYEESQSRYRPNVEKPEGYPLYNPERYFSKPWVGYFEGFEGVDVYTMLVQ